MDDSLLGHALRYAELGYPVFPLVPQTKVPLSGSNGLLDATTDTEQIEKWWTQNPEYNIGLATKGLCILDVDGANNPFLGRVPPDDLLRAPAVMTPRGGRHFWFRQNGVALPSTQSKIAEKVDTRADGGYVAVPPSIFIGKRYEWVEDVLRPDLLPVVPDWIVTSLVKPDGQPANKKPLAEMAGEPIPETKRNGTLYRYACAMRSYGLSRSEIETALQKMNTERCRPALEENEVRKIAESAAKRTPNEAKTALVAPEQPKIDGIVGQASGQTKATESTRRAYFFDELRAMPPCAWQIDRTIPLNSLFCLYGASQTGKSFVGIDWALCIATGNPWLGRFEVKQGKVAYVAAEGGYGIGKRFQAWVDYHGMNPGRNLSVVPFSFNLLDPPEAAALLKIIKDHLGEWPSLVMLDTLAKNFGGGDENTAKDMSRFVNNCITIRQLTGGNVGIVHHSGKDATKGARGSVSLLQGVETQIEATGAVSTGVVLRCEKQKDAAAFESIRLQRHLMPIQGDADGSLVLIPGGADIHLTDKLHDMLVTLKRAFHGDHWTYSEGLSAVEGIPTSTYKRNLEALVSGGWLGHGNGAYHLTEDTLLSLFDIGVNATP